MLPTTPKRPPQAEISPSTMFASPPPSSSSPGLFSSPLQQQTTTPGLWGSITPQQQHQLPLGLLNLTPDPSYLMSPDAGSATAKQHCNNPQSGFGGSRNNLGDSGRRGRPRADAIHHLRNLGSNSPSDIKCKVCSRVFPREKSLQVSPDMPDNSTGHPAVGEMLRVQTHSSVSGPLEDSHGREAVHLRLPGLRPSIHAVWTAQNSSEVARWREALCVLGRGVSNAVHYDCAA